MLLSVTYAIVHFDLLAIAISNQSNAYYAIYIIVWAIVYSHQVWCSISPGDLVICYSFLPCKGCRVLVDDPI